MLVPVLGRLGLWFTAV